MTVSNPNRLSAAGPIDPWASESVSALSCDASAGTSVRS